MALRTLLFASAILLGGASVAIAQSIPNFGPNAPATGDSYGKPYSGTHPMPSGSRAYRARARSAYAFQPRWHHRHYHHRYWYR
jgi:hypothetical protein